MESTGKQRKHRFLKTELAVVLSFLVFILIIIIAERSSNTPEATWADSNPVYRQRRDLSTPSSRLVGDWVCVTDGHKLVTDGHKLVTDGHKLVTDGHRLHFGRLQSSQNGNLPYGGIFFWNQQVVGFTILSEYHSEDQLTTSEYFFLGEDFISARVKYCLPKDGQSMSREMVFEDGAQLLLEYLYIDNKPPLLPTSVPDAI